MCLLTYILLTVIFKRSKCWPNTEHGNLSTIKIRNWPVGTYPKANLWATSKLCQYSSGTNQVRTTKTDAIRTTKVTNINFMPFMLCLLFRSRWLLVDGLNELSFSEKYNPDIRSDLWITNKYYIAAALTR